MDIGDHLLKFICKEIVEDLLDITKLGVEARAIFLQSPSEKQCVCRWPELKDDPVQPYRIMSKEEGQ